MMKMKLPIKTAEEGGDETAEDSLDLPENYRHITGAAPEHHRPDHRHVPGAVPEHHRHIPGAVPEDHRHIPGALPEHRRHIPGAVPPSSDSGDPDESPGPPVYPPQLDKESVFEWFGLHLNPAKRIELMCGLLHMCQPLELRFLGSYLEDLARKDYHVLRDSELRANCPSDLGVLTDVVDPVVMSKLVVCLSLLGSDSRECAGILFRILSHVDPDLFQKNPDYPLPQVDQDGSVTGLSPGPLEQLSLLFAMASLHPAFHFHQREVIRGQLDKIQLTMDKERQRSQHVTELTGQKADYLPSPALGLGECPASHPPCQNRRWATQREAVHIEEILLRGISRTRIDKEYKFEVKWSDSSSGSVIKTHLELENFLLKLPKDLCTESFEKSVLRLLNQGVRNESEDLERNLRERFLSAPPAFRQTRKVCSFFKCNSSYSSKPVTCYRCNCQLVKSYQEDCSDASSQDEDIQSYAQGHKKKHGTKSPCQSSLSSARGSQGQDSLRGGHAPDLVGPAERTKSCTLRSSQDVQQQRDTDKRSHPVPKAKSRGLTADRDKGKAAAFVANGRLVAALKPHRKGTGSGLDTFGETSSESYSSPSSPQHRGPESLDSEDDNNKDTDSHSDDSSKSPGPDPVSSVHPLSSTNPQVQTESHCPDTSTDFPPPLSFMRSLPFVLHNGAVDSPLPLLSPPEGKPPPSGTLMLPRGDPEKRDMLPTFGVPPLGLHPPAGPAVQPLVQRFKTSMCPSPADPCPAAPQLQAPVRVITPGPTSYPTPLQQDQAGVSLGLGSSLPHGETSHVNHPSLTLPSALPSPYTLAPGPPCVMPTVGGVAPSPGLIQAAVPPAVPTHTPGPDPSPSPALTHSTAHSDCTSYSNSSVSCGPGSHVGLQQTPQPTQQQQQQQPQQQPLGCGTCGCHNNCGGRGGVSSSVSVSQAPLFFSHQMASARQVFSVPPPLFQLRSLCNNSYLPQAPPPHQTNGATPLPPFFPTAPPPAHPSSYGPLHSDVPSHMLGTQAAAVAAAAAANYNLQQQMAPAAASFCQRVYQHVYPNSLGLLPAAALGGGGGVNKKSGNVSCYNCGVSGHYAQDCNQPSIDSTQQGGFQLRYATSHISEALDSGE